MEPMATAEATTVPDWASAVAGAFIAAALFFVLLTFGVTLGLGVSSASPSWRDTSFALAFLSGLYILLSAIISFGVGGYLGMKMRTRMSPAAAPEVGFRDGLHGLLVWAIAVVIGALLAALTASSLGAHGATGVTSAGAAPEPLLSYQLDRLLRSDRVPPADAVSYERAEAGRILLTSSSHSGVSGDDRNYLVRLVSRSAGLSAADAQHRVDAAIGESRDAIARARRSAVLIGFMTAAALLIGAAVAWEAASLAGRERDGALTDYNDWWSVPQLDFWRTRGHSASRPAEGSGGPEISRVP
jgi:hypothetical protein